jgi:hypothetical protein
MTTDDTLGKLILLAGAVLSSIAALLISGGNTNEVLEWARQHHAQAYAATIINLAAVPFLLAGVIAYWHSTQEASARLALIAAISLTVGYVGLAARYGAQGLGFTLAASLNIDLKTLAAAIDGDKLPVVIEKIAAFGGWLFGLLAALGAARTSSSLAALALLSVPFTLQLSRVGAWLPGALFVGAAAAAAYPRVRAQFGS